MSRSAAVKRLAHARDEFCGLGTRKVKLRLNKLAEQNVAARAYRCALEIEDASTLGKKYGNSEWGLKAYLRKHELIRELMELCEQERWLYGKQRNTEGWPRWIIYFHIKNCPQISFHADLDEDEKVPDYSGKWDGLKGSTLDKLEAAILNLL